MILLKEMVADSSGFLLTGESEPFHHELECHVCVSVRGKTIRYGIKSIIDVEDQNLDIASGASPLLDQPPCYCECSGCHSSDYDYLVSTRHRAVQPSTLKRTLVRSSSRGFSKIFQNKITFANPTLLPTPLRIISGGGLRALCIV